MPDGIITSRTVHEALHAGRYGKAMDVSPLLWLHCVSAALRAEQRRESPDSRARVLLQLLADITGDELARRRGRGPSREASIPERELALVKEDFRAGSIDREAWSVLHFRYLTEHDEPMRTVAKATGVPERTLRRRLERGCYLLAEALMEMEREAAATARRPHSLPAPLTKFIGREAELGAVRALLAEHRLVTLTGPGGIGKSRLAIRLATDLAGDFRDGACFVELAALAEGGHVPGAAMTALGLRDQAGRNPTESIVDYLGPRRQLLVVDNCEHLADAAGALLAMVLRRCAKVQVLATSRARLGLTGEAVWSVPPMGLPTDGQDVTVGQGIHHDALRLFTNRAAVAQSGFAMMEDNVALVSDICLQLDGIPLAIELAAAQVRLLSLAQLKERLADRFLLLRDGSEPQRPQHETLQASLDWSCELLGLRERYLLRRLSVFQGGWTIEAAEAVCSGGEIDAGAVFGLQAELEAKSMVEVRHTGLGPRIHMLETVRHYARQRLDEARETEMLQHQHLRHFQTLAEAARPELHRSHQVEWLSRLDAERENFRAALRWSLESGEIAGGLDLAKNLLEYWDVRSHWSEGRETLEALLADAGPQISPAAQGRALVDVGFLAVRQNEYEFARERLQSGQDLCAAAGDPTGIARALCGLGMAANDLGEYDAARRWYEQSIEICGLHEDRSGMAATLEKMGRLSIDSGAFERAQEYLQESLAIDVSIGNMRGIAASHGSLGTVAMRRGDYAAARRHYETGLHMLRDLGDKRAIASTLGNLANVIRQGGDFDAARRLLGESLSLLREIGDKLGTGKALVNLGNVYFISGDFDMAMQYYQQSLEIRMELGDRPGEVDLLNNMGLVAYRHGDIDAAQHFHRDALRTAHEIGHVLGSAHALALLARLAMHCGDLMEARKHNGDALAIRRETGYTFGVIESLEQSAEIESACGHALPTLRLAGAAAQARESIGAVLSEADADDLSARLAQARDLVTPEDAGRAFAEGHAVTLAEAVAYALGERSWEDLSRNPAA